MRPRSIAGRGESPRRTGGNGQGLREPPGNYCLPCSINTSKKIELSIQKLRAKRAVLENYLFFKKFPHEV